MNDSGVVWLAVIAISVAVMALIQIVVLIAIARLALQAVRGVRELRSELRPLIEKINQIADDARSVSARAVAQTERLEAMLASFAGRVDDTMSAIHGVVNGPIRQGSAVLAAIRAVMSSFGRRRDRQHASRDDEDALFVG